jgi:cytidine deaminase
VKKVKIETNLDVFESVSELPKSIQKLMDKAHKVGELAYAPYSQFKVGAALLLESGEMVAGNNQENAAYPSGMCAERVAIYQAGALYPDMTIVAMALTARSMKQETSTPVPPCGACRQAIAEYEVKQKAPIAIYFMGMKGPVFRSNSVRELLPLIFDNSYLQ